MLLQVYHGAPPAADHGREKDDDLIRECAPLCLALDSCRGGALEVGRGSTPRKSIARLRGAVKRFVKGFRGLAPLTSSGCGYEPCQPPRDRSVG